MLRLHKKELPNVVLRTHENEKVRFYDDLIKGRIVTINFTYTECTDGVCPLMAVNLAQVQRVLGERVGREIFMYSITLMPDHDTPAILKVYAERIGVKPGWRFLTGEPADIELLRRRLGFVDPDPVIDRQLDSHADGPEGTIPSPDRTPNSTYSMPCASPNDLLDEL